MRPRSSTCLRMARSLARVDGRWLVPLLLLGAGCSSQTSGATCGPGTVLDASVCYPASAAPSGDGGPTTSDAALDSEGGPSSPWTFGGVTSVAPADTTALQITWTAAENASIDSGLLLYHVYLGTSAGQENFAAPQATTPPGATSLLLDTGLQANTTYFVVVRAATAEGTEDSNRVELSATTQADTTPPTFVGVKSAATAPQSALTLGWTAGVDALTPAAGLRYYVYLGRSAGGEDLTAPTAISDFGATSITVSGLSAPGATYYAIVRAVDAAGNEDQNTVEASAMAGADTVPPVFGGCTAAVPSDAASVTVSWNAATDDSTPRDQIAYDVFWSTTPGGELGTTPVTFIGTTSGLVDNLISGQKYYFVCRARDASGNEDMNSSERFATTPLDSTPPTFLGLTNVNTTATGATLSWTTPASDDQTKPSAIVYLAYQSTSSAGEDFMQPVATSMPGATTIAINMLSPGTTYYWVVRARDRAGNSDANTAEVKGTTQASFSMNLCPIFANSCAASGCHVGAAGAAAGLRLDLCATAYEELVSMPSTELTTATLVKPGDSTASFLYEKLLPNPSAGQQMPLNAPPLSMDDLSLFRDWISEGAPSN